MPQLNSGCYSLLECAEIISHTISHTAASPIKKLLRNATPFYFGFFFYGFGFWFYADASEARGGEIMAA